MISEALQEIIQELAEIEDRMERFEFIFDLAEDVPELPIEAWNDDNRVKGCQSQAHLEVSLENDRVLLRGGADARLVQGLMGLLALGMHGRERLLASGAGARCAGCATCFCLREAPSSAEWEERQGTP